MTPLPKTAGPVPYDQPAGRRGADSAIFDLEIGSGSGEFALRRARSCENQLIAIEKSRTRFALFQKAIQKAGKPDNLWPLHTNAVWWLAHYGKKDIFKNIFILYPSPCPKKRQAGLRWARRPFMAYLLELLKPGGTVEFRTNMAFYSQELKERMPLFPGISLKEESPVNPNSSGETAFERKYLARGESLKILKFAKDPLY